jgi:DNA-binding transcriptional MocR family regulator
MPDFHNPTGRCMDIATRQAIPILQPNPHDAGGG